MATISTFPGTLSFLPGLPAATQTQTQIQKAEAKSAAERNRLNRLPEAAKGWADRHTLPELELLGELMTAYKSEGFAPVYVNGGTYAARLHISPDEVRARLAKLLESGAVIKMERLVGLPVFKPQPKTSETIATKADANINAFGASIGIRYGRDRA